VIRVWQYCQTKTQPSVSSAGLSFAVEAAVEGRDFVITKGFNPYSGYCVKPLNGIPEKEMPHEERKNPEP
jgi:hypothetical protein